MSQFIPILIVVFAMSLAIGPIMLMQPTRGQKRLASLRSGAAQRGLIVSSEQDGVSYIQPWKIPPKDLREWRLERQKFEHEAHFFKDWDWIGQAPRVDEADTSALQSVLERFDSYSAVGCNRVGVYVRWNEKLSGADIDMKLDELVAVLIQLSNVVPGVREA